MRSSHSISASASDSPSISLFLREEDARRALEHVLRDEPDWAGLFYVEPVELDERDVSAN